ncbi:MAG: response regulator transcription factor [Lachnospiraceae bacterium]|nr:response regulator transcription factor [Lachnospiraceae bacterium]
MNKTIMIVDDDIDIGNMLEELLKLEGYDVCRAYSGTEALMLAEKKTPDLILLDLMIPGISGEEVLKKVKSIPTIVVSAKSSVNSKVSLLMEGACDYVTKPFDSKELLARISVQLRKSNNSPRDNEENDGKIKVNDVTLDTKILTASVKGEDIALTRTECAILQILMLNPGRPIGRNTILDRIADSTPDCTERSLKQHISNIRKKLSSVDGVDYIEAIYGIGFKFKS